MIVVSPTEKQDSLIYWVACVSDVEGYDNNGLESRSDGECPVYDCFAYDIAGLRHIDITTLQRKSAYSIRNFGITIGSDGQCIWALSWKQVGRVRVPIRELKASLEPLG